jgi:uncharacterized protein DUF955
MSNDSFVVLPLSRRAIRDYTDSIRRQLEIDEPFFPIVEVVELVIPRIISGFFLDVCDEGEMTKRFGTGCHGMTFPDEKVMHIREDIYQRARRGEGRDRLTLAHELAHLLLHAGQRFARRASRGVKPYVQSEWQANCFAGELLVSYRHIQKCKTPYDAAELFGVSLQAAETQWVSFKKDGLVR